MIRNKLQNDLPLQILKAAAWSVFVGSLFYMDLLYAADPAAAATTQASEYKVPTLDEALANLESNVPSLMKMVTALAYLFGMFFVVKGVLELKHMGESRTMMSSEHGLKKPLMFLFVGGMLLYLPSAIKIGVATFWETPYPTAYLEDVSHASAWQIVINNSFTILQLIGVIAFIRGLIMLTHLSGHGGQQGTFARGMTHIIGGILCINMYDTVRMIGETLGLSGIFSGIS